MYKSSDKAIKRYSQYCGPAVASAVTGFSRVEVAKALRHLERSQGRKSRASTSITSLVDFFQVVGWSVRKFRYPSHPRQVRVHEWLRSNPTGTWLVTVSGHVIAVKDGRIVEDNGSPSLMGRVLLAIQLSETERTLRPQTGTTAVWQTSHGSNTCQTGNPHAKLVLQPEISRKETKTMNAILTTGSTHHQCVCSDNCPASTRRTFAQGHDARLVSRLRDEVLEGKLDRDQAYAELNRRAGANGLHYKLDNAICNAMDRLEKQADRAFAKAQAKEAKGPKAAKKTERTITVDGFELVANPTASEPNVTRKVGRWNRDGSITEHRLVGGEKTDTVRVFRYVDKQGNKQATTKHGNPDNGTN